MNTTELASRIGARPSGYGFMVKCPCHDDSTPSLFISNQNYKGFDYTHFYCHAGCKHEDIKSHYQAMGYMPTQKEYTPYNNYRPQYTPKIVATQENFTPVYKSLFSLLDDREAVQYMDRRHISKDLTQKYQIKNTSENTYGIQEELIQKFGEERLIKSGLLVKRKDKTLYNKQAIQDARAGNKKVCIVYSPLNVLSVYMLEYTEKYGYLVGISGVHNDKDLIDHLEGLRFLYQWITMKNK